MVIEESNRMGFLAMKIRKQVHISIPREHFSSLLGSVALLM
jgi:hypothetical protein